MNRVHSKSAKPDSDKTTRSSDTTALSPSRREALEGLLRDQRDQEIRKIRALVREDAVIEHESMGDELDLARRQEDLEFNVSLLDLSERRLAAVSSALKRLEQGTFGTCEECQQPISLARLQSLPMAKYCLDCQKAIESASNKQRTRAASFPRPTRLFDSYQPEPELHETIDDPTAPRDKPVPRYRRRSSNRSR